MTTLTLFTPAGALAKAEPLKRAAKRLAQLGFEVSTDADALARHQRFAGDDGRASVGTGGEAGVDQWLTNVEHVRRLEAGAVRAAQQHRLGRLETRRYFIRGR